MLHHLQSGSDQGEVSSPRRVEERADTIKLHHLPREEVLHNVATIDEKR
jgi:hypothetical protein